MSKIALGTDMKANGNSARGAWHKKDKSIKTGCKFWPDCFTCKYPDCIWPNIDKREIKEKNDSRS